MLKDGSSTLISTEFRSICRLSSKVLNFLDTFLKSGLLLYFFISLCRDIRNKAVGHFKRKYECFVVVVRAAPQFCGQSDLLIDCNVQLCRYPLYNIQLEFAVMRDM